FLTHPLRGEAPEAYREAMPALVEGAARLCLDLGANLLKIPSPGSRAACEAVTKVAGAVPWAVLSAGVDHAAFMPQVETALAAGASGVIAGRSLWKDCVFLDRARTREALVAKAVPRLREIKSALARHARPRAAA
ncbi:MAG: tagatose-bisphosphate aldolase, partial [Hyphomicrobiales bacterium]|nr:tagatose-bisphosphate aldolase [Hyphomicrobiales bacterium]